MPRPARRSSDPCASSPVSQGVAAEGLLDEDMQACARRCETVGSMRVVGRGDSERVRTLEQRLERQCVDAECRGEGFCARGRPRANACERRSGRDEGGGVNLSRPPAGTDDASTDNAHVSPAPRDAPGYARPRNSRSWTRTSMLSNSAKAAARWSESRSNAVSPFSGVPRIGLPMMPVSVKSEWSVGNQKYW